MEEPPNYQVRVGVGGRSPDEEDFAWFHGRFPLVSLDTVVLLSSYWRTETRSSCKFSYVSYVVTPFERETLKREKKLSPWSRELHKEEEACFFTAVEFMFPWDCGLRSMLIQNSSTVLSLPSLPRYRQAPCQEIPFTALFRCLHQLDPGSYGSRRE